MELCKPEAAIYVWQRVPRGLTDVSFAELLLKPDIALVTTPGSWLGEKPSVGEHPGADYVRFALVPPVERCNEAVERIRSALL